MSKQEKLKEKFKKRIAFYKQKSKRRSNKRKATVLHYNYDSETGKLIPHTSRAQRQMDASFGNYTVKCLDSNTESKKSWNY